MKFSPAIEKAHGLLPEQSLFFYKGSKFHDNITIIDLNITLNVG